MSKIHCCRKQHHHTGDYQKQSWPTNWSPNKEHYTRFRRAFKEMTRKGYWSQSNWLSIHHKNSSLHVGTYSHLIKVCRSGYWLRQQNTLPLSWGMVHVMTLQQVQEENFNTKKLNWLNSSNQILSFSVFLALHEQEAPTTRKSINGGGPKAKSLTIVQVELPPHAKHHHDNTIRGQSTNILRS